MLPEAFFKKIYDSYHVYEFHHFQKVYISCSHSLEMRDEAILLSDHQSH